MKSSWIKPNLNGFVIFICAVSFSFFIYILFVPVQVSTTFSLQGGIAPNFVREYPLSWKIFPFLCILAYPISIRLGCGIPKQKKMPLASFFQYIIFVIVVFINMLL